MSSVWLFFSFFCFCLTSSKMAIAAEIDVIKSLDPIEIVKFTITGGYPSLPDEKGEWCSEEDILRIGAKKKSREIRCSEFSTPGLRGKQLRHQELDITLDDVNFLKSLIEKTLMEAVVKSSENSEVYVDTADDYTVTLEVKSLVKRARLKKFRHNSKYEPAVAEAIRAIEVTFLPQFFKEGAL